MADTVKDEKPKIRRLKGFGLQYLCGKDKVLFENGVYLPREDFDAIKDTPETVQERIDQSLASEPQYCGFDWTYACSTGTMRRKKGAAAMVVNPRTERHRERQTRHATEAVIEEQKKAALRQYVFSSAFLVMVVMAIVGVGSAVMSAYHTSTFLYEGGKPWWASLMTGIMLILFSGTAFTAARYFFQEKGALCVFGLLFTVAGLAVIVYSMFSTLTVNYNQFQWRDDAQAAVAAESSEALASHREQIRLLEEEIGAVTLEIGRLERDADYWRTQTWRRYDEIIQQLIPLTEYRRGLQEQRVELVGETPRLVEVEAVSQETVYGFLASLFAVKEDAMRFFVYVVPACLYDILAPFALSVVLLLADKRRKQHE
jgi:ABC-type multidrug transport system fused ATPase/permease subunit